jgi:hypothetical protein
VPGNAMRFVKRHYREARRVGNGFSVQFVAGTGVVFEVACTGGRIGLGLLHWLTAIAHFERGEFVVMRQNRIGEFAQQSTALERRQACPRATIGGFARSTHGFANIVCVAAREMCKHLPVTRIKHRNRFAVFARDTFIVDEMSCHTFSLRSYETNERDLMRSMNRPPL